MEALEFIVGFLVGMAIVCAIRRIKKPKDQAP